MLYFLDEALVEALVTLLRGCVFDTELARAVVALGLTIRDGMVPILLAVNTGWRKYLYVM